MDKSKIAQRLIALRGNRPKEEIALALGISVASISEYEKGERIPNDSLKIKISEYFGESVDRIFFE